MAFVLELQGGGQGPGRREALCSVAVTVGGSDRRATVVAGETVTAGGVALADLPLRQSVVAEEHVVGPEAVERLPGSSAIEAMNPG